MSDPVSPEKPILSSSEEALLLASEAAAAQLSANFTELTSSLTRQVAEVSQGTLIHLQHHEATSLALAEQVEVSAGELYALIEKCNSLRAEFARIDQLREQIKTLVRTVDTLYQLISTMKPPPTAARK